MSMLVQPPGQTVHQLTPAHSYANVEDDVFMSGGEAPRLIIVVLRHFDLFSYTVCKIFRNEELLSNLKNEAATKRTLQDDYNDTPKTKTG